MNRKLNCRRIPTFKNLYRNAILNLLLLLCNTKAQTVTLDYSSSAASCTGGEMITGTDFIILNGVIDLQTESASDWKLDIPIQYRVNPAFPFVTTCIVQMINTCNNDGTDCYCTEHSGSVYKFIVNKTAISSFSGATFQAELTRYDFNGVQRGSVTIPVIYEKAVANLTMNNNPINIGSCKETLGNNEQYSFVFCGSNLKNPKLSIQFGTASIEQESSQCITRTTTTPSDFSNLAYTFQYSDDCKRSENYTCSITKPPSSVDYTDTIIGVVVGVGSCLLIAGIVIAVLIYRKEKPKCSDSKIILVIVVTVAGSVVIVGIIIGLLYYFNVCKFKKANKQPTGLTLTETKTTTNVPPVSRERHT